MALVLLSCVIFFALLNPWNSTEEAVGRAVSLSWSRSITIEALRPVSREDWRDRIPPNASLGRCTSKLHHTQDEPAPGATEICGTPYVVDKGTGYGEVVQECRYQVYADWCAYTTQEWTKVDVLTLDGVDPYPQWPVPSLSAQQREGKRDERYQVVFDIGDRNVTYTTGDVDRFRRFEIGSRWRLEVNSRGGVRVIEPVR
jgi:hypothetical protein